MFCPHCAQRQTSNEARTASARANSTRNVRALQTTPRACSTSSPMSRRSSNDATPTETKVEGPTEADDAPSLSDSVSPADASLDMSLEESLRGRIRREG